MRQISLNSCRNESIVSQSFCHAFPVSSPSVKIIIQLGSWTKWIESCDVCNGMLCDLVFSIYLNPDVQIQPPTDLSEYIKWLSVIPELCWTCILFASQHLKVQIQVLYVVKWTETWSDMHDHIRQEVQIKITNGRKFRSRDQVDYLFNSRHFITHRKQGNLLKDSCGASWFDLYSLFPMQLNGQ